MSYLRFEHEDILSEHGRPYLVIKNTYQVGHIFGWKSGVAFDADEIASLPHPIEISFSRRYGYKGPLPDWIDIGIPILSVRLHEELIKAGVTTLQTYSAVLTNPADAERVNCLAFNIAAKHKLADATDEAPLPRLFRQEENVNSVVVHPDIQAALSAAGFNRLTYRQPYSTNH